MHSPHLSEESCSTSLRACYTHELLEILLHRFVSSPLYLLNHLFISVGTHGYLFCTLGYNPIPLCYSNCSYFSYIVPLTYSHHCVLLSISLLSGTDALDLESAISPRIPGSSYWKVVLETKI